MQRKTTVSLMISFAVTIGSFVMLLAAAPQDAGGPSGQLEKSRGAFGPPGGPGDPPTGFGPGMFLAPQVLEFADANADGKLSLDEPPRPLKSSFARPIARSEGQ